MKQENFVVQLHNFLEAKGLTKDEAKNYLIEVFKKAFEKDKDALSRYEDQDPELANVKVEIDMTTGQVNIEKSLEVVLEKTIISRFRQIELEDKRLIGTNLKVGDTYIEKIKLEDINLGKRQHIKQLFLQKLSEAEKTKVYKKFIKFKGELLNAKIHKILNRGNIILDYNGDSIFMPATEISPLDRDKIIEGKYLTIFVLEIEEISKDAQIIASRKNPYFVAKLIEREINDVSDGIVKIESIAREAGFKTKVAVSTTVPEVDPVGSIIGIKGQRIKQIVDEIGGERLDVIKYHEDIKQFIAESLLPAEIIGIKISESEDGLRNAIIIVEEDQFLPAIGKQGLNIKLAAILTKTKLDVKTISEAKAENINYEKINKTKFIPRNNRSFNVDIDFDDFDSIEEMAEENGPSNSNMVLSDSDYEMYENNINKFSKKNHHNYNNLYKNDEFKNNSYDEDDEG